MGNIKKKLNTTTESEMKQALILAAAASCANLIQAAPTRMN